MVDYGSLGRPSESVRYIGLDNVDIGQTIVEFEGARPLQSPHGENLEMGPYIVIYRCVILIPRYL